MFIRGSDINFFCCICDFIFANILFNALYHRNKLKIDHPDPNLDLTMLFKVYTGLYRTRLKSPSKWCTPLKTSGSLLVIKQNDRLCSPCIYFLLAMIVKSKTFQSTNWLMVEYKTLHVKSGNFFGSITFDSSLIIQS